MASGHLIPRATFMGVPAEVRLQIYDHLFTPCRSGDNPYGARMLDHNCSWPSGFEREPDTTTTVRCSCKPSKHRLYASVLITNQQIYHEARGILYKNLELRVCLPGRHTRKLSPLEEMLHVLPSYALPEIRRMLIIGCEEQATVRHCCSDFVWRDAMEEYTALIASAFPNLSHLCLYVEAQHPKTGPAAASAAASFAAVAMIPSLRSVTVQADRTDWWTENLLHLIKEALEVAREMARRNEHRKSTAMPPNILA